MPQKTDCGSAKDTLVYHNSEYKSSKIMHMTYLSTVISRRKPTVSRGF